MTIITSRAHGADISKYDQTFDPALVTGQLDFVIQRISYGMTRDERFDALTPAVMQVPIRGAYHYLSSQYTAQQQADKFLSFLQGYLCHFINCDFESAYNLMDTAFAKKAWDWIQYVHQKTSLPVLLYTSTSLYNKYIYPSEVMYHISWNTVPLWQAEWHYVDNAANGTPSTPLGRTAGWMFWQYTNHGDGAAYGVTPHGEFDLDVYNGTPAQLRNWLEISDTPPDTGGTMIETHKGVIALDLNVRVGPPVNGALAALAGLTLHKNDIVYGVLDVSQWFHFDRVVRATGETQTFDGWASAVSSGYMTVMPYTSPATPAHTVDVLVDGVNVFHKELD